MLTTVILCGGLGTRIALVADGKPKALLPVGGRPFLWYLLQQLQQQGITHVVLSTGHLGDQIADFVRDGSLWPLELCCVRETTALGTGGAVRLAADTLQLDEPLLVVNGDTFFSGRVAVLKAFHDARPDACGSLALAHVANASRYGRVGVDAQTGAVKQFAEKHTGANQAAWINAGMYILEPELVRSIPVAQVVSLEHKVFPAWVGRGLYGCRIDGAQFLDFGTPADYAKAHSVVHSFHRPVGP